MSHHRSSPYEPDHKEKEPKTDVHGEPVTDIDGNEVEKTTAEPVEDGTTEADSSDSETPDVS